MMDAEKRTDIPAGKPDADRPVKKPPPVKREKPPNLSVKRIERLKEPGRYRDGATRGLYLRWDSPSSASWLYRYEVAGRERWMGLGSLADVSLDEARDAAIEARKGLRKKMGGTDPIEAKRTQRAAEAPVTSAKPVEAPTALPSAASFQEVARQYHDTKRGEWKNAKHAAQFISTLSQYVFPHIGAMNVADIKTEHVLLCLLPIWKTKTETASRVRGRIANVLDDAKARGLRPGDNPADWLFLRKSLSHPNKIAKTEHHAAIRYEDIPAFMKVLAARPGIAAKALEFTVLTAARTGETIGAVWSEIDWEARLWKIPAERMKVDREHQVPLSQRAIVILKSLNKTREKNNPFIFVGDQKGKGLSNAAMMAVIKRMINADPAMEKLLGLPNGKHMTVHGFRSAFRDWGGDQTDHDRGALEWSLAHNVYTGVEGSYARSTLLAKRFPLMKEWADYCSGKLPLRPVIVMDDDEDVAA